MAAALRDSFSDKALEHTLDLLNCHMPHKVYTSKYAFLKSVRNSCYKEFYSCYDCCLLLNFESDSEYESKFSICNQILF